MTSAPLTLDQVLQVPIFFDPNTDYSFLLHNPTWLTEGKNGVKPSFKLVFVTLNRIVWEEHWKPKVYGQSAEDMVAVLKKLEREIWSIASMVLNSQQRQDLRDLIHQWRKKHPDKLGVMFIRFSNFGELGRKPSLEEARKAGGFLAPVEEAVQAADEVRALADRAIYLLIRMQELVSLRAKLTIQDLITTPEIDKLLSDITGFRKVSERYAELIENLPAQISNQTNATIEQVMGQVALQSEEIISYLLQQVAMERRSALDQAFQGITQERNATLDQIFQGLEEQRTVTIRQVLHGVSEERQAIMRDLIQLADRGEREAEEWITHIFVLVAAIMFVFFMLRLAYRYAAEQPAEARKGRLPASVGLVLVAVFVVVTALTYVNRDIGKSSVTPGTGQNDQDNEPSVYESSKHPGRTEDMQSKADVAITVKNVPAVISDIENSSQPSTTTLLQKTTTSDQKSDLAPDPVLATQEPAPVEPEVDNTLDTGQPTSQQETVTNKDMSDTRKKETLAKTLTSLQESQTHVHTSTSAVSVQSTYEYEQIFAKQLIFDSGGWQLTPETYETLDEVVAYLKKKESLRLIIQGHSDSRGPEGLNQKLSEKRAEAVAAYLVRSGVSSHRLKTVGYGSSQPVATNETPEGRAQNRRVAIKTIP